MGYTEIMRRTISRAVRVAFVATLMASLVCTALAAEAAPPTSVAPPAAWDTSIAPIAAKVAELRGLQFQHPVAVRFQDDAAFDAEIQAADRASTPGEQAARQVQLKELRALGLIPGALNLERLLGEPDTSNILAYYDPATKLITVRGTTLTPMHKVTIAHELTHALDDQWFDLLGLQNRAKTSSAFSGRDALIEGDAERIETRYRLQLPADEQAQVSQEEEAMASSTAVGENPVGAAEIFSALEEAPYVLGQAMVDAIVGTEAQAGLDATFRSPPNSDEAAFNPLVAVRPHARVTVPHPTLRDGEQRNGSVDDIGPTLLYFILASRIDPVTALHAADAWAGDSTIPFDRDGSQCVRATVAGHDKSGTDRIARALAEYQDAMRSGDVTTKRPNSRRVEFTACDPGKAARVPAAWATRAMRQLELRNDVTSVSLAGGLNYVDASCAADRIVDDPLFKAVARTTGSLTADQRDALWSRYDKIESDCVKSHAVT